MAAGNQTASLLQLLLLPLTATVAAACSTIEVQLPASGVAESVAQAMSWVYRVEEIEADAVMLLQRVGQRLSAVPVEVDTGIGQLAQKEATWSAAVGDAGASRSAQTGSTSLLSAKATLRRGWGLPFLEISHLTPFFVVASALLTCGFATFHACSAPIFERRVTQKGRQSGVLVQPECLEARVAAAAAARDLSADMMQSAVSLRASRPGSIPCLSKPSRQQAAGEVYGAYTADAFAPHRAANSRLSNPRSDLQAPVPSLRMAAGTPAHLSSAS